MKYEMDFKREQFPPNGVILLSTQKCSRLRNLLSRYDDIGFTDYSLVELALMSTKQWKNRDYPIPEGYKRSHNKILSKLSPIELIKNDIKSHSNVK